MPQLQYDYDYYEYQKTRKATKSRSTTNSGRSTSRTAVSNSVREANRASVRAAINSDDELYVRRSTPSKRNVSQEQVAIVTTKPKPKKSPGVSEQDTKQVAKQVTKSNQATQMAKRKKVQNINQSTKKKVASQKANVKKQSNLQNPKSKKKKVEKPKEMSLKNAEVMVNPSTKVQMAAQKRYNAFKTVMYSLFAFSILFLICYRSSIINESFKSLNKMKTELDNTRTVNAQIESEIQTQTDLSNIETYAKYQLGMQKPKESQIRKIVVEKEDKIATPVVVSVEEEETNFWKNVVNDIMHILD